MTADGRTSEGNDNVIGAVLGRGDHGARAEAAVLKLDLGRKASAG